MTKDEISRKLQALRVEKNYTQRQLADMLGIKNYSTVSSWEIGKSEPSLSMFAKICAIYGISDIDEVFPGVNSNGTTRLNDGRHHEDKGGLRLTPQEQKIGRAYGKAAPPVKRIVEVALEPYMEEAKAEFAAEFVPEIPDETKPKVIDELAAHRDRRRAQTEAKEVSTRMLPIVNRASGGDVTEDVGMEWEYVPADEAPVFATAGFYINGHSMEPEYPDGSIVWIDENAEVRDGDIGVFVYNAGLTCKQLDVQGRRVFLQPLNETFKPLEVFEDTNYKAIGRVLN